ncbi:MAG: HmuY family protein [Chitinophagaceae bacterium]
MLTLKIMISSNISRLALLALLWSNAACMSKEQLVPVKPQGAEQIASVELGEDYKWQVYYSLENNKEIARNLITDWDLAFECGTAGYRITLNSAKFRMGVYPVYGKDFSSVSAKDSSGIKLRTDLYTGLLDSTAIGDWRSGKPVFIVNRGIDAGGKNTGTCKIQVLESDAASYTVRVSGLDNSNDTLLTVEKDDRYTFTQVSLANGAAILHTEPPAKDWDIVFTKYTHFYTDLNMPYAVVGCLLNRYSTFAAVDTMHTDFSSITLQSAENVSFSSLINTIGFEWKSYDINAGLYTVDSKKYYLVKVQSGAYYKMRFTGFYKNGLKGAPEWQFQRL